MNDFLIGNTYARFNTFGNWEAEIQCSLVGKENRIHTRGEFTRKKCKTAILLYCFRTACVLHIFMLYKLLGPGISFYRKSKIDIKRKPND